MFILVGSVAFFWLGRPIIIQLRRHSLNLEKEVGERKQIEEHLRISKERLSGFMESATDGFVLLDSTLNHIMMNHAAYTITGLETESVLGKNILETIPGIHESGRYDAYKEVIKTGKPIHIIDITSYPMTGVKHIELKAFKVGDGLGIILTDISNRMQAEQHEKTRNKMLELLAGDAPLPIILNSIVRGMEILHPDTLCSILLLDKEGKHLEKGVAPSLPNFYNAAIDGIEIGIGVGSCGTAACAS